MIYLRKPIMMFVYNLESSVGLSFITNSFLSRKFINKRRTIIYRLMIVIMASVAAFQLHKLTIKVSPRKDVSA